MAVRTLPQPLFLSTLPCYHVNQIWGPILFYILLLLLLRFFFDFWLDLKLFCLFEKAYRCGYRHLQANAKYPVPVVVAQPTSDREPLERQTKLAESERKWAGGTSQVEDDADDNGKNKCFEMNGRREKVRWT
ncbi:hypothetical protein RUM43_001801 [Polyplax serrata]|uniref:Uncharacterized protein n=1 Tax=Polyplax serrata TaxID=468196 RepID=A0AAN8SFC9_POLSC